MLRDVQHEPFSVPLPGQRSQRRAVTSHPPRLIINLQPFTSYSTVQGCSLPMRNCLGACSHALASAKCSISASAESSSRAPSAKSASTSDWPLASSCNSSRSGRPAGRDGGGAARRWSERRKELHSGTCQATAQRPGLRTLVGIGGQLDDSLERSAGQLDGRQPPLLKHKAQPLRGDGEAARKRDLRCVCVGRGVGGWMGARAPTWAGARAG